MRSKVMVAAGVAMWALASCSDGGDGQAATDDQIADMIGEQYAEEDPAADSASVETQRSEFVGECMDAAGFEYLRPDSAVSPIDELGLDAEEFALQYGFGISTMFEADAERFAERASGNSYQDQIMAMPEDERSAYLDAEQQCLQDSYIEFGLPMNGSFSLPEGSEIMDRQMAAQEAAAQDERVEEARAGWAGCMQEQGYDYAAMEDMIRPLELEAMPLQEAFMGALNTALENGEDITGITPESALTAEQFEQLAQLQQRELTVAAAHQACIGQGHDFEAVLHDVTMEYLAEEFSS